MGCHSEENIWKPKSEKCHNQCFEFTDVLGACAIPYVFHLGRKALSLKTTEA